MKNKKPLSGHQSARPITTSWLTPPDWIERLGPFDLDPCCPPDMPWRTATRMISLPEDGLTAEWVGRVWLNPPFDRQVGEWLERLVQHGNGIALVAARTETKWFWHSIWCIADAVCFVRGRPHFHRPDGTRGESNSGAPIALIAYGEANAKLLEESSFGATVRMHK